MKDWILACLFGLLLSGMPGPCCAAQAQSEAASPRIALIVANAHYADPKDDLSSPIKDAQTMQAALKQVGFTVKIEKDLGKQALLAVIKNFKDQVKNAGPNAIAVFYYVGHGGAAPGAKDNYLLPIDVPHVATADPARQGVSVRNELIARIQDLDRRRAVIFIIDACRTGSSGQAKKAGGAGGMTMLAPEELGAGFLVAHSTSDNKPAADDGRYASVLAKLITKDGLTLEETFDELRRQIHNDDSKQFPRFTSGLGDKVCLLRCAGAQAEGDPLAVLKHAAESYAVGDVGQIAAAMQMVNQKKSLAGMDLRGVGFKGAVLNEADFSRAALALTDFTQGSLIKANLAEAAFAFAKLDNVKAMEAIANQATFFFAQAERADFTGLKGRQSNWQAASLANARFKGAQLQGASFQMADLRGADFTGADLRGAFFNGALIQGAKFEGANIGNTDFSAAVGSASQFTPKQQAELCGTRGRPNNTYRYDLRSFVKSTVYASGKEWTTILNGWAPLPDGMKFLKECRPRTLLAAGNEPVWNTGNHEEMMETFTISFPAELLEAANREADILSRARASLKRLQGPVDDRSIVTVPSQRHRDLLTVLRGRVGEVKLQAPARLGRDSVFLYRLRYRPQSVSEQLWKQEAVEQLRRDNPAEGSDPEGNRWPAFFPAGTLAEELTAQHMQLFKQWSINRARAFPTRVLSKLDARSLDVKLSSMQDMQADPAHTPYLTVKPLAEYGAENGAEPAFHEPGLWSKMAAFPNVFRINGAAVSLPQTLDSFQVRIPRSMAEEVRKNANGRIEVYLNIRGVDLVSVQYLELPVLSASVASLRIVLRNGRTLP